MSRTGTWRRQVSAALGAGAALLAAVAWPLEPAPQGADAEVAAASGVGGGAGAPGPGGAGPSEVLPPDESWTVTLLTGEVVEVQSDAEGRVTAQVTEHDGPYRTLREADGSLFVIPLAVTPMVGDVLDMELFDVTGLIEQGYDDESRDSIGLIVEREPGVAVQESFDSPIEQPLPSIGAVAVEVPKASADEVGGEIQTQSAAPGDPDELFDGVTKVWLDSRVSSTWAQRPDSALAGSTSTAPAGVAQAPSLDPNLPQIGADVAWNAGLTGEGATVAILDSGIDPNHPDLQNKIVAAENFTWEEDTDDLLGHGTHVAAIAAGTGAGAPGTRSGVAPGASIVNAKVLDSGGGGWESDVILGMEWAAPQADVVGMSLGVVSTGVDDPLSLAVDQLTEQHDTLFVVAAGNSGPLSRTIDSPGSAAEALTVGAVDFEDNLAEFSGRGPTVESYALKPEVLAPGVDIVAARAAQGYIGEPVDEQYVRMSGTSMATPHVAGAAALLVQQHPDWTHEQLKSVLTGSVDPIGGDGYNTGSGRLDIGTGTVSTLQAQPGVVTTLLPDPRTEPHRETVTWTNHGPEPLAVDFAAELQDRAGNAVDAVSVEPAEASIDPGGTVSVTVTIDGPSLEKGLHSGAVTAQPAGGQPPARLPLGVYAAPQFVDLTIEATSPAQVPEERAPYFFYAIVNLDDAGEAWHAGELNRYGGVDGSSVTVTVPSGRYSVTGDVSSGDNMTSVVAQVGDPDIAIAEDTTVAFDGAAAVPLEPQVEGVETAATHTHSEMVVWPAAGAGDWGLLTSSVFTSYPAPPVRLTPMEADPEVFAARQIYRLQAPHLVAEGPAGGIEVSGIPGLPRYPALGEHTLEVVDAGDGSDFTGAEGRLALARLPEFPWETGDIADRAAQAGVAVLAFVAEDRSHLTFPPGDSQFWPERPVISAAGQGAADLIAAAAQGEDVTITVTESPYVYDIVGPQSNVVDPHRVIDQAAQHQLATVDEHFYRDRDGLPLVSGSRYYWDADIPFRMDTEGPLPEHRTAYVSPDVFMSSAAFGVVDDPEFGKGVTLFSANAGETYEAGEQATHHWLRRPQWPAPVGGTQLGGCQPTPVRRTADQLEVWLNPLQDDPDRFNCVDPIEPTMTLTRDGEVIDSVDRHWNAFELPDDVGTYVLTYEQEMQAPYAHRSETRWTFQSAAPAEGEAAVPVPLLVVDYDLPLDTLNQPTGDEMVLSVAQVTGAEQHAVRRPQVRTSIDGGQSWQRARVHDTGEGTFEVTLPEVEPGTSVSLKVKARDRSGNRIEQTLYDAYVG